MSFILGLWGIAAGFVGFILLSVARSAVHERVAHHFSMFSLSLPPSS